MFRSKVWPLCLAIGSAVGAAWLVSWVGRGPVLLGRWLRLRTKLPKATARERAS